jgi:hypothetical protein
VSTEDVMVSLELGLRLDVRLLSYVLTMVASGAQAPMHPTLRFGYGRLLFSPQIEPVHLTDVS